MANMQPNIALYYYNKNRKMVEKIVAWDKAESAEKRIKKAGYKIIDVQAIPSKSDIRKFKLNPTLKGKRTKPAFMIVGQTEGGKEYYFNGPGFGDDVDVVLTFPNENAARRKAKALKNMLPAKIRYLYVHPA